MCWRKWIHRSYYTWWWMERSNFWLVIPVVVIRVINSGGSMGRWRIAIWRRWMTRLIFWGIKGGDDRRGRLLWTKRRRENLRGMMWMKIRRENPRGRRIGFILGGTWCWCIDRFQNWRWLERGDDGRGMMMWKMRRWEHWYRRKTEIVNGCVIIPSRIGFRNGWWMERRDDGWGVITRKPRERWWGQVRTTLYVIVPEIILNDRGLGSNLWWRIDNPPIMIGAIT